MIQKIALHTKYTKIEVQSAIIKKFMEAMYILQGIRYWLTVSLQTWLSLLRGQVEVKHPLSHHHHLWDYYRLHIV